MAPIFTPSQLENIRKQQLESVLAKHQDSSNAASQATGSSPDGTPQDETPPHDDKPEYRRSARHIDHRDVEKDDQDERLHRQVSKLAEKYAKLERDFRRVEESERAMRKWTEQQTVEMLFLRSEVRSLRRERNGLVDVVLALCADVKGLARAECLDSQVESEEVRRILQSYRPGQADAVEIEREILALRMRKGVAEKVGGEDDRPFEELETHFRRLRQLRDGSGALGVAPEAISQAVGGEDARRKEGDDCFDEID